MNAGSPGSHARCFGTCTGSVTARDSGTPRDIGVPDGAFPFLLQGRRPGVSVFRGCIPGPHVPLSTLRRHPRGRLRMTRGRCGSLIHFRMTLSLTTPCEIALVQNANLRELCRSVSEEEDFGRMKLLVDELYRALDERELLAS